MINKLNLSRTCSRFCKIINKQKQTIRFLKNCKEITHHFASFLPLQTFCEYFKLKFYNTHVVEKSDQFYINYVLKKICDFITPEKILAHLFWCTRNRLLFNCDLCVKVPQFYNEIPDGFINKAFFHELWNKNVERVFDERYCYQGVVLKQSCVCDNIENLSTVAAFANFYGVLLIRIFFNIIRKHVLSVKLKNKELFLNFFREESKTIFNSRCSDLDIDCITNLAKRIKPNLDYNPSFTKITNINYINYLTCI